MNGDKRRWRADGKHRKTLHAATSAFVCATYVRAVRIKRAALPHRAARRARWHRARNRITRCAAAASSPPPRALPQTAPLRARTAALPLPPCCAASDVGGNAVRNMFAYSSASCAACVRAAPRVRAAHGVAASIKKRW